MSRSLSRTLLLAVSLLLPLTAVHADETLSYDANGNVETRTLPWGTTQYGYDDLDRVTSEAGPARTQSFTYDANDNRLTDGSGSKTYTPNTDRLLTENGQSIVLDAAGNITQLRGLTLAWNQAGQLKSVSRSGTLLTTYYYDYKGRRSRKVLEGSGSLTYRTTIYIHDLYDHLIGEFNGAGSPLRTYVWRDDIPVAIIDHPGDRVLYLETDHLNTPIAARNQAGTVVWKWESDAFGASLPNGDPDGDGMATTINLRFPGQYYDKESGLHYNHHRYYDSKLGRYLSPDPIGIAGGSNMFGYANQNPLKFSDPSGLFVGDPSDYAIVQVVATATGVAVSTVAAVAGGVVAALYPTSTAMEPDDRSWRRPSRWLVYVRCHVKKEAQCENCPDTIGGKAYGSTFGQANAQAQMDANANLGYQNARNCQARHCQPVACFESGRRIACPMSGR